jgi:hypothetical protein
MPADASERAFVTEALLVGQAAFAPQSTTATYFLVSPDSRQDQAQQLAGCARKTPLGVRSPSWDGAWCPARMPAAPATTKAAGGTALLGSVELGVKAAFEQTQHMHYDCDVGSSTMGWLQRHTQMTSHESMRMHMQYKT